VQDKALQECLHLCLKDKLATSLVLVVLNFVRWYGEHLKFSDCEVYTSDVRLRVEVHDLLTYPDFMLICSEPKLYDGRLDTV
jgi:hypothetical protein